MRFLSLVVLIAFVASCSACLGGSGGGGCCPPAQPACGNPCGGGVAPMAAGPVVGYAPPPSYPVAGGNAYPTAGK